MRNLTSYCSVTGGRASPNIWGDCPEEIFTDPGVGVAFYDDFTDDWTYAATTGDVTTTKGPYRIFNSGGSSAGYGWANSATEAGGQLIVSASDQDDDAFNMQATGAGALLATAKGKAWFECRIKTSNITDTKLPIFVGLVGAKECGTAILPIVAAGTIAAGIDCVGFFRLEADGDKWDVIFQAAGQTQNALITDAATIVADTYMNLGFKFDPGAATAQRLTFYADNVDLATYGTGTLMDGATFPSTVSLVPTLAIKNAAATLTASTVTIDWWAMAQVL